MERHVIECNVCVICGEPIPEGRIICPNCEKEYNHDEDEDED